MHQFWDKYDRHTICRSFFEVNYSEFFAELALKDCEQFINTRLREDLLDDNLNWIKDLIVSGLELIETCFKTEQYLCSHKRLVDFMQNAVHYTKIERTYLSYLEHPLKNGLSFGENTLRSSLLRLLCLIKDFILTLEFDSKSGLDEDFENFKDLVYNISVFFKKELRYLIASDDFVQANYFSERKITLEILSLCERIETLQSNRKRTLKKPVPKQREAIDFPKVDEVTLLMRGEISKADYNTQMIKSLNLEAYSHSGLGYRQLEPERLIVSKSEKLEPLLRKRCMYVDGMIVDAEYNSAEECCRKQYNIHKYDREIVDKVQRSKEDIPGTLTTIFTRRDSIQEDQDTSIMNFGETITSPAGSGNELNKRDRFPMTTSIILDQPDQEFSKKIELLSLIDFDYDPEAGWSITTNLQQQRKMKQIEIELEEQSKGGYTQNTLPSTDYTYHKDSSRINSRFTLEDTDEDTTMRDRRARLANPNVNIILETNEESQRFETSFNIDTNAFKKRISSGNTYLQANKSLNSERKIATAQSNFTEEEELLDKNQTTERTNAHKGNIGKLINNDEGLKEFLRRMLNDKSERPENSNLSNKSFNSFSKCYEGLLKKAGLSLGARKARINYLWQVARDFVNLKIFLKQNFEHSDEKYLEIFTKVQASELSRSLSEDQESLITYS